MKYKDCFPTKEGDLAKRLESLQKILQEKKIDAYVVEHPIDLLYLTGLSLSLGQLWIFPDEAVLFVDSRYIEAAKQGPIAAELIGEESLGKWIEKKDIRKVGFDANSLSYARVQEIKKRVRKRGFSVRWIACNRFVSMVRRKKQVAEIVSIKKSAALLWRGFQFLSSQLKVGITEKDLARKLEIFCLEEGGEGMAFEPIIAFGKNSALPHHRATDQPLREKDVVLIDIGMVVDRYHSDMTRVLFFQGEDPLLRSWYEIIQRAHDAAFEICKEGTCVGDLDARARLVLKEEGVEQYFTHSLGHGIGLETHESPRIRETGEESGMLLVPGMIFTIEPGLYLPGRGGVRYENMILITEEGAENLVPLR